MSFKIAALMSSVSKAGRQRRIYSEVFRKSIRGYATEADIKDGLNPDSLERSTLREDKSMIARVDGNDKKDPRDARFVYTPKQINPSPAIDLIAEQKPIECEGRVALCDGGHAGLGHPKVYINLDKPGTHACGYCGLRFYQQHSDPGAGAHIQV